MRKKLNKKHLNNLAKLADFLETQIEDSRFRISHFRQKSSGRICNFVKKTDCGSVGCAVGWAPWVVKTYPKDFEADLVFPNGTLDFNKYARRVFGCSASDDSIGEYMFGGIWSGHDIGRTRKATIKRIRSVVEAEGILTQKMVDDCPFRLIYAYRDFNLSDTVYYRERCVR